MRRLAVVVLAALLLVYVIGLSLMIAATPASGAAPAAATQWGTYYPTPAHPDEDLWAGRADVARVFEPDRLGLWDDYPELHRAYDQGVRRFWISWKGTRGSDVRAFAATIPYGVQVWGTWWHEPEDDIADGRLTLADWKSNTKRLANAMRQVGIKPATILMYWTLDPASGRDVRDYRPAAKWVDVWGWDGHMKGNRTPKMLAAGLAAEKAATGKPVGLAETSAPDRPERLHWLHQRLDGDVWWACFFARRNDPVTKPEIDAWLGGES